jgi:hypothetical protein
VAHDQPLAQVADDVLDDTLDGVELTVHANAIGSRPITSRESAIR